MRISNDGPEVFYSYASRKSRSEITVWMPWPLNCDLGGGAKWPSNHFRLYTACCICTEAQDMRAPCMFDWQGTHDILLPLWNAKSQILCVHCIIQISQLHLLCVHCVIQMIIQITHFALVWKQSKSHLVDVATKTLWGKWDLGCDFILYSHITEYYSWKLYIRWKMVPKLYQIGLALMSFIW